MTFELKDGQGTLHKNDKQGVDKRPDYRGDLMLDGVMHEISAWLKEGKRGKWMSLSVKPKDVQHGERMTPEKPKAERAADDVPW